jgi:hypothetical protein
MTGKSFHPATLVAQGLGWTDASTGGIVLPVHTSRGSCGRPARHVLGAQELAENFAETWGVGVEFVDATSLDAMNQAVRRGRTCLVWIETPANPLWSVTDIAGAAEIAHRVGALLAVDSTAATPVLTRPLALGADLVMHSATKYLNGHSDVMAGTLTTASEDAFWARLCSAGSSGGAILGGFEAYLFATVSSFDRRRNIPYSRLRISAFPCRRTVKPPGSTGGLV